MQQLIKLLFFLQIIAFNLFALQAQIIEPEIKFQLYFEDAIGNKDTVTIGFDSLASANINALFGEYNLRGTPFDSVFEVRGADKSGYVYQSNPVVYGYLPLFCTTVPAVQYPSVIIYAKHWPITITWDSTYFAEDCYDWTHITRIWEYLFHPEFVDGDIRLLKEQSSLTVYKQYMQQSVSYYNSRLEPIEGGGQDTVYNLWVGLCGHEPGIVDTDEPGSVEYLTISPNPVSSVLHLVSPSGAYMQLDRVEIVDMDGKELLSLRQVAIGSSIDVSHLSAGMYTLKAYQQGSSVPIVLSVLKI